MNALGGDLRGVLLAGIERAEAEGVGAVLIYSEGRTYFSGADIREFGKPPQDPWLPVLCDRIEASPLLVVSALHGTALGGELEGGAVLPLSHCCTFGQGRIARGQPRYHSGGWWYQRLPSVTDVEAALGMITTGQHVCAPEALELGVQDRVEAGEPRDIGLAYTRDLLDSNAPRCL